MTTKYKIGFVLQNHKDTIGKTLEGILKFQEHFDSYCIIETSPEDLETRDIIREKIGIPEGSKDGSMFMLHGNEVLKEFSGHCGEVEVQYDEYVETEERFIGFADIEKTTTKTIIEHLPLSTQAYLINAYQMIIQDLDRKDKRHARIGYFFRKGGRTELAIKHYKMAIETLAPENPDISSIYTECLMCMKPSDSEYFQLVSKFILAFPKSLEANYFFIQYLNHYGLKDMAMACLKDIVEKNVEGNYVSIVVQWNTLVLDVLYDSKKYEMWLGFAKRVLPFVQNPDDTRKKLIEVVKASHGRDIEDEKDVYMSPDGSIQIFDKPVLVFSSQNVDIQEKAEALDYYTNSTDKLNADQMVVVWKSKESMIQLFRDKQLALFQTIETDTRNRNLFDYYIRHMDSIQQFHLTANDERIVYIDVEPTIESASHFVSMNLTNTNYIGFAKGELQNADKINEILNGFPVTVIAGVSDEKAMNVCSVLKAVGVSNPESLYIWKYCDDKFAENTPNVACERKHVHVKLEKVSVINLLERRDRWERIQGSMKDIFRVERFDAIKATPGWIGCFRSHQELIRRAKAEGRDMVLVMEDDCYFKVSSGDEATNFTKSASVSTDGANSRREVKEPEKVVQTWNTIQSWLREHKSDWDVFLGGCASIQKDDVVNTTMISGTDIRMVQLEKATSTHFICYNASIYDTILAYTPVASTYMPIDVFLIQTARRRIWTCLPFFAYQTADYSDIEKRVVDYDNFYTSSQNMIRAKMAEFVKQTEPAKFIVQSSFTDLKEYKYQPSRDTIVWIDSAGEIPDMYGSYRKVAVLCEPKVIQDVEPRSYSFVQQNSHLFDLILTYDENILKKCSNAKLLEYGTTWIDEPDRKIYDSKEYMISMICGGKKITQNHLIRRALYDRQKEIYIPKMFYRSGRDVNVIPEIEINPILSKETKLDVFKRPMFHLVVENSCEKNYFSEKLLDCFLTGTVPVYYGCSNIADYFDTRGMILLNGTVDDMVATLNSIAPAEYHKRKQYLSENFNRGMKYVDYKGRMMDAIRALDVQKKVSIAISTYEAHGDGVSLLTHNLNSIRKQEYPNIEVCISDHSKDDVIEKFVKSYSGLNIVYKRNSEKYGNISNNINSAINLCTGEYIKILFMDDYLADSSSITKTVQAMEQNKCKWLVSSYVHTKDHLQYFGKTTPRWSDAIRIGTNTMGCPSGITIHKSVHERFDENVKWFMDTEFYTQLFDAYGQPEYLDETTVITLQHDKQVTNTDIDQALVDKERAYLKTKYPAKQYVISPILQGGLGNRMFQIASGFGVAQKQGKSLFITGMAQNAHSSTDYFKSIFRNVPRKAMEIQAVFQEPQESALEYLNIPNEPIDMLMLGYMQSPKYFEEYRSSILDMFAMASEQKAAILAKYPDVGERYFLHVRRGDYLKLEMHNIDLMDYYHRAIQFIGRDAKYLVCSDDIAWCKTWSELEGVDVMFIEDDEVMTLYTMSMCSKGGICANSSFSWWGAYLNQNSHKRVVFPDKWFNNSWKNEIYPESSIIVSVRDLV